MNTPANKTTQDLRCIWMQAGIVNYKLCDRDFQCDQCQFHQLMLGIIPENASPGRNLSAPVDTDPGIQQQVQMYLQALLRECKLHLDRYYHPGHFWCKPLASDQIAVGLNPLTLKILEPVQEIVLPECGKHYRQGQLMAWVIRKNKMIPLHAFTSGKVSRHNPALRSQKAAQLIYDDEYLFEMTLKVEDSRQSEWYDNLQSMMNYSRQIQTIRKHLLKAVKDAGGHLGITLADGGELIPDLEMVLGQELYGQLLQELSLQ